MKIQINSLENVLKWFVFGILSFTIKTGEIAYDAILIFKKNFNFIVIINKNLNYNFIIFLIVHEILL